jgi:hypothetical protein
LAEQGINLSVARLIWAYKVEAEVDERGVEIPVDIFNYTQVLSFFSLAKGKTRKLTKSRSGSNCCGVVDVHVTNSLAKVLKEER